MPNDPVPAEGRRGFHAAAPTLLESGWFPMPLPPGRKDPPEPGLTGKKPDALRAAKSVKSWKKRIGTYLEDDSYADWNTGVRLPDNVFALDVDEYIVPEKNVTKHGWQNLEQYSRSLGLSDLPPTLRLTSRGYKDISGQRFFRLPDGVNIEETLAGLPGELVPGVEVLRPWHRYTIEAGSLHPLGGTYRVYDERKAGTKAQRPLKRGLASVTPDELPVIPEDWLNALLMAAPPTGVGKEAPATEEARRMAAVALEEWLGEYDDGTEGISKAELLDVLSVGARHSVLQFQDPSRNNANVPSACISLLATLMEDLERGEAIPLRETISLSRDLYVSGGNKVDRPGEFDRALVWAFPLAKQSVAQQFTGAMVDWADQKMQDQFWGQTEILRSCRDFARSRMVSPEAMLACAIVLVSSWLPPHLTLPPLVGSESSLNFYVALCATSGGGKSSAMSAAKDWLQVRPHPDADLETDTPFTTTIATGEGLLAAYTTTSPKKSKTGRTGQAEYVQHRRSVRFEVDEIQSLGASMNRDGSTLRGFLKQMWTGSAPSTLAADTARIRKLEDHSFRTTIVAGVQPGSADVILSDHAGGFPQRWLWVETWDDNQLSDEELDECQRNPPPPLVWSPPRAAYKLPLPKNDKDDDEELSPYALLMRNVSEAEEKHEVLDVTESIRVKVRRAKRAGRRIGDTSASMEEALDAHKVHLEEKLAALIAALHGHVGITDQYERMAEWLCRKSDETRAAILRERQEEDRKMMDAKAARQGRTEALAADVREQTEQERFNERVMQKLLELDGEAKLSVLNRILNLNRLGSREERIEALNAVPGIMVDDDDIVRLDLDGEES